MNQHFFRVWSWLKRWLVERGHVVSELTVNPVIPEHENRSELESTPEQEEQLSEGPVLQYIWFTESRQYVSINNKSSTSVGRPVFLIADSHL